MGLISFRKDKMECRLKAVWADNQSFDEVLISRRMVQDHMPDMVLGALESVSRNSYR